MGSYLGDFVGGSAASGGNFSAIYRMHVTQTHADGYSFTVDVSPSASLPLTSTHGDCTNLTYTLHGYMPYYGGGLDISQFNPPLAHFNPAGSDVGDETLFKWKEYKTGMGASVTDKSYTVDASGATIDTPTETKSGAPVAAFYVASFTTFFRLAGVPPPCSGYFRGWFSGKFQDGSTTRILEWKGYGNPCAPQLIGTPPYPNTSTPNLGCYLSRLWAQAFDAPSDINLDKYSYLEGYEPTPGSPTQTNGFPSFAP